jgi:hypothetical protein
MQITSAGVLVLLPALLHGGRQQGHDMLTWAGVRWRTARMCWEHAVEPIARRDHRGHDISPLHSARNTSTMSGNHVRCRSPAGMRSPSREVRELVQPPPGGHTAPEPGEPYHPIGMLVLQTVGRA